MLALTNVKLGNKLERIEERAFGHTVTLERITIPVKDGWITNDYNIFQNCSNLNHVDLTEGELHETIDALYLEEWRNDMNQEIDLINQLLPDLNPGRCVSGDGEIILPDLNPEGWVFNYDDDDRVSRARDVYVPCEKTEAIRGWIRSVLHKITPSRTPTLIGRGCFDYTRACSAK